MLKLKKTIVLSITTAILYYALISPNLLPAVTIPVKDALIISIFCNSEFVLNKTHWFN